MPKATPTTDTSAQATSPATASALPAIPAQSDVVAQPAAAPVSVPAANYVVPVLPQVPVVKGKSYAAPLSFIGSARRIGALISRLSSGNVAVAIALWATLGLLSVGLAWTFVLCWYVVIFGIFGIFTFPYRLIRRSQRKSQHLQQVSLATQQAMLLQQQQMLQQGRVQ